MSKETSVPTKAVTGVVRLSYANLWRPKSYKGQDPKFGTAILIKKTDKATIDRINAAWKAAKEIGIKEKWGSKIPTKVAEMKNSPLRDGDDKDDEGYKGHWYLNANNKTKPGIVDKDLNPILDENEVYSGCYARVSLTFFPFAVPENKSIGCALNHVQKVKDGEPFSGRSSAEDDFAGVATDDDEDEADFM